MRKSGILIFGAVPGLAIGYIILTGLLLGRVRPIPITLLPREISA